MIRIAILDAYQNVSPEVVLPVAACRTSGDERLVVAHRGERVHEFPGLRNACG